MEDLEPGDPVSVGSYRLLSRLGAGGMGQVFLGMSPGGRKVAVKLIHSVHAGSAQFRERFAREIEAARRVGGFHTAPVVDADPEADPPWMVTAYIEGPSLEAAVARDGPLLPDQVYALGAGLAEGLAAIHACGLVHRDLKPANVIMAGDGPRIIDFGIARAAGAVTLTTAGAMIGTFTYMSPEQLNGDPAGPASDVFSLGGVLAFAATGRLPFGGDSAAAVVLRITTGPPDLAGLAEGQLRRLIEGCLARSPAARPALADVLAALASAGPLPVPLTSGDKVPAAAGEDARTRTRGVPGESPAGGVSGPPAPVRIREPQPSGRTKTAPRPEPSPALQVPPVQPRRLAASYVGGLLVAAGCFIAANFLPLGGFSSYASSGIKVAHVTETFNLIHPFMKQIATGPDAAQVYISQWIAPLLGLGTAVSLTLAVLFPLLLQSADPADLKTRTQSAYRLSLAWEIVFGFLLVFFTVLSWINVPNNSDNPADSLYDRATVQFGAWLLFAASCMVATTLQQTGKRLGLPWATKPRQRHLQNRNTAPR